MVVFGTGGLVLGSNGFTPPPQQAATPTFSPASGTYTSTQTVTISCATPSSTIYYTTDGTQPTYPVSGTTAQYTGPIAVNVSETVNAIAIASGYTTSSVGMAIYTISSGAQALIVTRAPNGGSYAGTQSVTLAAGTFGSKIYYTTDGTTPTTSSLQYSPASPIQITGNTQLSAIAVAPGYSNSLVSSSFYYIYSAQVATPTFSPAGGSYTGSQSVVINVATSGVTIYYTTDGSQPTTSSNVYSGPVVVSATGVVKAFATKTGLAPSVIGGAGYTINGVVYNKRLPYSSAGIKVVGNTFSNGTQQGILMGANMSGLEYIPVQEAFTGAGETGDWAGIAPNWSNAATWNFNCVRIPLNAGSWLGLTCTAINSAGTGWGTTANCDHNGTYRASVLSAVASANAIGCYVILDLHWSAPYLTIGGVTNLTAPLGQPPFANTDTDTAFWASIAQTFAGNPTVMFELFNEPYSSGYTSETNARSLALYGGAFSRWTQTGYSYNAQNTGNWYQLGFQSMVTTIRQYATNVILYSGQEFSQSMKYRIQDLPYDPLGNIAAIAHPYPNTYNGNNNYPYSAYGPYGAVGADTGYAAPSATDILESVNVLYGGIPVMNTEDGGTAGTAATATPYSEPHIAYMAYNFCDTYGASFIAWQFNLIASWNTTNTSNFLNRTTSATNSTAVPITGQGTTFYNWTTGHA
jgi:hypothetical protein